ncbi:MAG: EAL domain-containing protein [Pseudomonadota bacterium]
MARVLHASAVEAARLEALNDLAILDTEPEARFERIVAIVCRVLQVPIAAVSFVDVDRVWFKAKRGVEFDEVPRDMAFCAHTVAVDDLLVVEDARADPRFRAHALVRDGDARFYAGAPIRSAAGLAIGVLCAVDLRPRRLTPDERSLLVSLAEVTGDQVELRMANVGLERAIAEQRRTSEELTRAKKRLRVFLDTASDWLWEIDAEHRFTYASARPVGVIPSEHFLGRTAWDAVDADPAGADWLPLREALTRQRPFRQYRVAMPQPDGKLLHLEASGDPVFDEAGRWTGFCGCARDVTAMVEAEGRLREFALRIETLENANVIGVAAGEGAAITSANDEFLRTIGRSRAELQAGALEWSELTPPGWEEVDAAIVDEVLDAGHSKPREKAFVRPDGTHVPVLLTAFLVDRERFTWQALVQDISERRRAEAGMRELSARLRALQESNIIGIAAGTFDQVVSANAEFLRITGYDHDDLAAGRITRAGFVTPRRHDAAARIIAAFQASGRCDPYETEIRQKDGSSIAVMIAAVLTDPERGAWQALVQDISARKTAETRMRELGRRLEVLEAANVIGVFAGEGERLFSANDEFLRMLGRDRRDLEAGALTWPALTPPEWLAGDKVMLQVLARDGRCPLYEKEFLRSDGSRVPVMITAVLLDGERGTWQGLAQDISERRRAEARVADLAFKDALTGLPNRRAFNERLAAVVAHSVGALVFVDLDHFKDVNDTLGHDAGDALLSEIAARLQRAVRKDDVVARLGGDEFAIILAGERDSDDLALVADRVTAALQQPVAFEERTIHPAGSLGITRFPQDGRDVEQLMKNADIALYRAKTQGRRAFCFFDPAMRTATLARIELAAELRQGLAADEFELVYQPVVGLVDGRLRGFEALLRWRHPTRGLLAPPAFLEAADTAGLLAELGDRVLERVADQLRRWRAEGYEPGVVAVNIAGRHFRCPGFAEYLIARLAAHDVTPACLALEITEDVLVAAEDRIEATVQALRAAGIGIALDDFGTGRASLSHLQRFPVDVLKLDRSFVDGIDHDPQKAVLARTVVNLAHNLEMHAIAEGVETESQKATLRAMGCDFAQGYLFARPGPADAMEAWPQPRSPGFRHHRMRRTSVPGLARADAHLRTGDTRGESSTTRRDAPFRRV